MLLEGALRDQLLQQYGVECVYTPHQDGLFGCLTQADIQEQNDAGNIQGQEDDVRVIGDSSGPADQAAVQASRGNSQPGGQNGELSVHA